MRTRKKFGEKFGGSRVNTLFFALQKNRVFTRLPPNFSPKFLFLAILLSCTSCGYHLAGKRLDGGKGVTIAVPTFINRTTLGYRLEQRFSESVRQELVRRTHFPVESAEAGVLV